MKSAVFYLLCAVLASAFDDLELPEDEFGFVNYKGHKLIHAEPKTQNHLNVLRFISKCELENQP